MHQSGPFISSHCLEKHGIRNVGVAHRNYTTPALHEEDLRRREGKPAPGGARVGATARHSVRAATAAIYGA